ncbi:MAG: tRNA pseudouridine(55) synthase TruB [Candidatus Acidiferrales bacterium]
MPRNIQPPHIDGAVVIDKPSGKTSHDVVEAMRRLVGFRQVGHLGTLDPLATGVLVLLLGRATRLAQFYTGRRKRYDCTVRFGYSTDTYDSEGEPQGPDGAPILDREALARFAAGFLGRIQQVPPAFSAKKIHGRPAHELARKKKPVTLKSVEVEIYEFRLTEIAGSRAKFTIECGAGTYIRALAHELGKLEGSGAHLCEISRTAVGEFTLDQATKLEELAETARAGRLAERVIRLEALLPELPRVTILPVLERRVRHGAKFNIPIAQIQPGRKTVAQNAPEELDSGDWKPARLRVFNSQEQLVCIAQAVVPRTYQPIVVLEATP